jgi:TM2 domain-containing membrane protein YozV
MNKMNNIPLSYLLWCGCFFGFCGLHRIYNKKIISGVFWFCTFGVLGIGQLIDLTLIPNLVDEHNYKMRRKLGISEQGIPLSYDPNPTLVSKYHQDTKKLSQEDIMIILAKAAAQQGGQLTLNQAVVETSLSFEQVETTLNMMFKKGYVMIDNDLNTGAIIYYFR